MARLSSVGLISKIPVLSVEVNLQGCEGWINGQMTKPLLRFVVRVGGCLNRTLWKWARRVVVEKLKSGYRLRQTAG